MPGLSYDQLMRPGQILKAIQRLRTPANFFQNFLGINPYSGSPTMASDRDTFGYDVYAATRTLAPVSPGYAPPVQGARKPIGQELATVYRFHPSRQIFHNEVFASRPLGSFGLNTPVDTMGMKYIALQLADAKTEIDNSIEWMVAHMLKGGFGIKPDGDSFRLCKADDPLAISVNTYQIPAENQGDLDGIIASGEEWNLATAPIINHMMEIEVMCARISGYPVRHIIINGNTAAFLFNNTKLAQTGGTSFQIFNSITKRPVKADEPPTSGNYDVVFRALPQYTFHIYNEGLVEDEVIKNEEEQISTTNFKMLVPDGYAIMIPEPSSNWVGWGTSKEVILETTNSQPRVVQGFTNWRTLEIDPARFEAKFLLKYVPLLMMPKVVFYANVWGT